MHNQYIFPFISYKNLSENKESLVAISKKKVELKKFYGNIYTQIYKMQSTKKR